MEIPKTFQSEIAENKWYAYWMQKGYFRSVPDEREPYTIVIPPPNVTGVLHMGHMLNNTLQDVMIRRARMLGKNACWVPGTDHASIATEAKVVQMLREKGIKKSDLTRDEFSVRGKGDKITISEGINRIQAAQAHGRDCHSHGNPCHTE